MTSPTQFHDCTHNRETDPFVERLQKLAHELPKLCLKVHSAAHGERIQAEMLGHATGKAPEIWFCGPKKLADALTRRLRELNRKPAAFHREFFEMR